jgi:glycosyltransferase involved in cell wall biosynthesis
MNIALFTFAYAPFEGGAEIAARETISRLKDLNFSIFTYRFNKDWSALEGGENFNIVRVGHGSKSNKYYGRIWNKIYYVYAAWQEAERAHRKKRFDAVWAITASYAGLAALLFKMNHPKVPLFLTLKEKESGWPLLFGKKIIRSADLIQCTSQYLADFAAKSGARCSVEVIPGGVDIELFKTKYSNTEIKSLRDSLGIKDEYVILTTAKLVYKNGVDILIKAVAKLKEKRPLVKLLIAGEGGNANKLKAECKRLAVDANVIFLGDILHKDLPIYFRVSDVFVKPARLECLGNSFLEAMVAGVPAIGTPVGGIVDFLKDPSAGSGQNPSVGSGQNPTGFLVEPENPEDLAEKINFVLGHKDIREKVVANAKKLIERHYSWDIIAEKMEEVFKRLTGEGESLK